MRRGRWGFLLVMGLLLAGCGGSLPPAPTATPMPTVVSTATQEQVTLGEVVWATRVDPASGEPLDRISALPNTAPRVVAAVSAGMLPAGVTLQAHWTIDGDPLTALDPAPVVTSEARENAWVTWTLSWTSDQPWPLGVLGIVIDVNGQTRASDEIQIVRDAG